MDDERDLDETADEQDELEVDAEEAPADGDLDDPDLDEPDPDDGEPDDESADDSDLLDPDGVIGGLDSVPLAERLDDGLNYDCTDWSGESRSLLDAMLTSAGIRHSWQGTVLGVAPEAEADVDALIEEVLAAATPALDRSRDLVAYEVGTWSAALQSSLAESLAVADIAYEWDDRGDLLVYAEDEERVEQIFEGLPDPDDPEISGDDGIAVQDLLSSLFVAAGHLAKKARDASAVVDAAEAADQLERVSLPFGFEPAVWRNLVALATNLRDALAEDDPDEQLADEEISELAAALRSTLREFV